MARWLVVVRPEGVDRFPLPAEGLVRIGRAVGNDLRVEDSSLSRRHAILHVGRELRLEDLGGTNPTRIRRRGRDNPGDTDRLLEVERETVTVEAGDRILLGALQLAVHQAEADVPASPPVVADPAMQALFEEARRVARSPINLLLLGETGAGKEVLAEFIHAQSPRAAAPFVAINCSAVSESLLEAELFGAERGAFTGATQARAGLLEAADRGTLLLDEVGEMSPSAQAKLLRVLEDHKIMRVGGRVAKQIDVRVIAATNRDLAPENASTFRSDLYFRLAGAILRVPPLRERKLDIAPLSRTFLGRASATLGVAPPTLNGSVLQMLEAHTWPGNVRELRNAIERAVALCTGPALQLDHLPRSIVRVGELEHGTASVLPAVQHRTDPVTRLKGELEDAERQRILDALQQSSGNQTRAAALLGISRRTLLTRLVSFEIPRPRKG